MKIGGRGSSCDSRSNSSSSRGSSDSGSGSSSSCSGGDGGERAAAVMMTKESKTETQTETGAKEYYLGWKRGGEKTKDPSDDDVESQSDNDYKSLTI